MKNTIDSAQLSIDFLDKLSKVLNYQLSTTVLLILTYAGGLTIVVTTIAAILFSPYMLYVLYLEKKYGWIIFFTILVFVPIVIFISLSIWELLFVPLALAYFYYFLLKFVVRDWIQERNSKIAFMKQLKQSKKKENEEENLNYLIQK